RGGNPEVINEGKNGFVVHHFDQPEAYAQVINSLFSNEALREKLGRSGRVKVDVEFGWSRVASNLRTVYENAVRR
ncbi:MAG: glycosyltransferase, partial [Anaerobacillus sp.]